MTLTTGLLTLWQGEAEANSVNQRESNPRYLSCADKVQVESRFRYLPFIVKSFIIAKVMSSIRADKIAVSL